MLIVFIAILVAVRRLVFTTASVIVKVFVERNCLRRLDYDLHFGEIRFDKYAIFLPALLPLLTRRYLLFCVIRFTVLLIRALSANHTKWRL